MKYILAKFTDNWADEIDIHGCALFTEKQWASFQNKVQKATYPVERSIGSNQQIEYYSAKDYLGRLQVEELLSKEAEVVRETICRAKYGTRCQYGKFIVPFDE